MLGTPSALNDGPLAKSSVWDSDRFKDISHSPIANSCTHIAKHHDDRHRAPSWDDALQRSIK
jgi:hypothetical protein